MNRQQIAQMMAQQPQQLQMPQFQQPQNPGMGMLAQAMMQRGGQPQGRPMAFQGSGYHDNGPVQNPTAAATGRLNSMYGY